MKTTIIEPCEQYPGGAVLSAPDTEAPDMAARAAESRGDAAAESAPVPAAKAKATAAPVETTTEDTTDGRQQ
jgi:hypothetical protein